MEKNNFMKKLSSIFKSNLLINKIQKKKKSKEEIKKLKEIKKKIKKIESVEEFETVISELETDEIIDEKYFEKLKKKKKRKLERQSFEDRLRCDTETLNRIANVLKNFKGQARKREEKDLILNREERERNGGVKEKEKNKSRQERTRESGGRTRGSR